ncbi:MAG: hypothetical protein RBU27_05670 [Bacteroidota bacterium]|jgi:hypothetical protein|nr:hypothetical protein [Bacteroidota bacterium]
MKSSSNASGQRGTSVPTVLIRCYGKHDRLIGVLREGYHIWTSMDHDSRLTHLRRQLRPMVIQTYDWTLEGADRTTEIARDAYYKKFTHTDEVVEGQYRRRPPTRPTRPRNPGLTVLIAAFNEKGRKLGEVTVLYSEWTDMNYTERLAFVSGILERDVAHVQWNYEQ